MQRYVDIQGTVVIFNRRNEYLFSTRIYKNMNLHKNPMIHYFYITPLQYYFFKESTFCKISK